VLMAGVALSLHAQVVPNEPLTGRQVLPPDNWWRLDVTRAPWTRTRQRSSTSSAVARFRHLPPYGACTRISGRPRTASPTSSCRARSRASPSRSWTTATRATAERRVNPVPNPDAARTTPNYIEGGVPGGGDNGDRHLVLIDRDRWLLYETWATRWNASLSRWEAGQGRCSTWPPTRGARGLDVSRCRRARDLPWPGPVRRGPRAGEIGHAFRVTVRSTNGHVWPASHSAGATVARCPWAPA